MEGGESA